MPLSPAPRLRKADFRREQPARVLSSQEPRVPHQVAAGSLRRRGFGQTGITVLPDPALGTGNSWPARPALQGSVGVFLRLPPAGQGARSRRRLPVAGGRPRSASPRRLLPDSSGRRAVRSAGRAGTDARCGPWRPRPEERGDACRSRRAVRSPGERLPGAGRANPKRSLKTLRLVASGVGGGCVWGGIAKNPKGLES